MNENKKGVRAVKHTVKTKNPIAVAHQKTGGSKAGAHKDKSKEIPRHAKHKSKPMEGWTTDSLADHIFEQDHTYEDKLQRQLEGKLSFMEGASAAAKRGAIAISKRESGKYSKKDGHRLKENADEQTDMTMHELYKIAKDAMRILNMVKEGRPIEPWEASFISVAADHLNAIVEQMEPIGD